MYKVKDFDEFFMELKRFLIKHDLDFYNGDIDDDIYDDRIDTITQEIIFYLQGKGNFNLMGEWLND